MQIELPDWVVRAPADIGGLLALLREREAQLAEETADVRQWIKKAERLAAAMKDWSQADDPVAELRTASKHRGVPGQVVPSPAQEPELTPLRAQIQDVLTQDTQRWWKPKEVTEALGHDNVNSVRGTLSDMAERGLLLKHPDGGYRWRPIPDGMPLVNGRERGDAVTV